MSHNTAFAKLKKRMVMFEQFSLFVMEVFFLQPAVR